MAKTLYEYGIHEATIRGFVKSINSLVDEKESLPTGLLERRCLFRNQKGIFYGDDEKLFDYCCKRRAERKCVSRRDLGKQARRYAKELNIYDFRASEGYTLKATLQNS